MHPLASVLNAHIDSCNRFLLPLFSQKGKEIFFPKKGILGQTAEAKCCQYNATIGTASEDDGSPMRLPSLDRFVQLKPEDVYPYASSYGLQPLREMWAEMMRQKNPSLQGHSSLPVVTCGLTGALSVAAYMFVDPLDTIVLPDMYWGNYNLLFGHGYGAMLKTYTTFTDTKLNIDSLQSSFQSSEKYIVLLNFPNNPSGYTLTEEEAVQLVHILTEAAEAAEKGMVVLLDDAYFGLVYEEGVYSQSLFAVLSQASEKLLAVKIDGATKEDYAWGHRVGFVTFGCKGMTPELAQSLEDKAAGVVRGQISSACHLSQSLLLSLYQSPTYAQEKREKFSILQSRYDAVQNAVHSSGICNVAKPLPFNSGYFMCLQLHDDLDAEEVRLALLRQYDVGVIAIGSSLLRIAYSCLSEEAIHFVFSSITDACASLSPISYAHSSKHSAASC